MKRRDFVRVTTTAAAASLLPASLISKNVIENNKKKFPAVLKPSIKNGVKEFELFIDIFQQEIVPAFKIHTLAFNNQIPGPEIRVQQGDKVRVKFKNKTEINHTIHWHGIHVPWRMDGVPYVTQMPVMPGQEPGMPPSMPSTVKSSGSA
jgi:FtsP/CotA-like multicopper oxidase with cupredoxin domain